MNYDDSKVKFLTILPENSKSLVLIHCSDKKNCFLEKLELEIDFYWPPDCKSVSLQHNLDYEIYILGGIKSVNNY